MKIAFCVADKNPNADLGAHLARSEAFVFVDTKTGDRRVHENPARKMTSGAGVAAADFLVGLHPDAVVAGMFGSKASHVLAAAGVVMFRATSGSIDTFLQSNPEMKRLLTTGGAREFSKVTPWLKLLIIDKGYYAR